jgi:hypothetical protein
MCLTQHHLFDSPYDVKVYDADTVWKKVNFLLGADVISGLTVQ